MTEPKRPNFMKMEVAKQAPKPPPKPPEKEYEKTQEIVVGEMTIDEPKAAAPAAYDRAEIAAQAIRTAFPGVEQARIGVVLGSGLGGFGDTLDGVKHLGYEMVPGFPRSTVVGHRGRLAFGTASGVPVLAMQGRFHRYEGYPLADVTFPVRVFGRLGVKLLVLTNAAGGISPGLAAGDIMLIEDHLNLMGESPLAGPNDERFGPRFPDMTEAYPRRFREAVVSCAPTGCAVKSGVYAAMPGPNYETPAEIRMLAKLGADAVGMSTVPEAIVANHMGLGVVGLSGIANMAAGLEKGKRLTHAEVVENMKKMSGMFITLLAAAIPTLDRQLK